MSRHVQVFAHRGARRVAPENTLPAFAAALEMGVDGIELDVHVTSDGQIVVIHDFDVRTTTDGAGQVNSMTAAQVNALDAGSHFSPTFAGTRVPTLGEVFDLVGNRCAVNIEIKSEDPYARDASDAVVAFIQHRQLYDQVIVSSFNPVTLIKLRYLDHLVPLGLLYEAEMPPFLRDALAGPPIQPEAHHPHYHAVDHSYMIWAQQIGARVNTWTVNDPLEAQHLAALGVSVIMSDVPDQIIAALR